MNLAASRPRVAIIGAGVGGLTAAHLLQKKCDVTLYEASSSLGGHAHSETVSIGELQIAVDTAFLIFNDHTYKEFSNLLKDLDVSDRAIPAEMSSCFSDPAKNLFFTLGAGWSPFLANLRVFARPELFQIVRDLFKFRARAVRDLDGQRDLTGITSGDYLADFSTAFRENLVWPLTSAIWSLADGQMQNYPIKALLDYFDNHQLLRGKSEKKWRTFRGSSSVYVDAFVNRFTGHINLNTPVSAITRNDVKGVAVDSQLYDFAILATHADTSYRLITAPSAVESELLGAWTYQNNPVVLHQDIRVLHDDPRMWGSWNMRRLDSSYQISYYLNRLQNLPTSLPMILTLGTPELDETKVLKRFNYRHPIFNAASVATQGRLSKLNEDGRLFFCGSYFGHGFHEDAVRSAVDVAAYFGCRFSD